MGDRRCISSCAKQYLLVLFLFPSAIALVFLFQNNRLKRADRLIATLDSRRGIQTSRFINLSMAYEFESKLLPMPRFMNLHARETAGSTFWSSSENEYGGTDPLDQEFQLYLTYRDEGWDSNVAREIFEKAARELMADCAHLGLNVDWESELVEGGGKRVKVSFRWRFPDDKWRKSFEEIKEESQ